jgi:hypothetical protein
VASEYTITHESDGRWYMYRARKLVDSDHDPEHAALSEIFRWATLVALAEDGTVVRDWSQVDDSTYRSVSD